MSLVRVVTSTSRLEHNALSLRQSIGGTYTEGKVLPRGGLAGHASIALVGLDSPSSYA
jgi:hypothetical protein